MGGAFGGQADLGPEPGPQALAAPADLGRQPVDPDLPRLAHDPAPDPGDLGVERLRSGVLAAGERGLDEREPLLELPDAQFVLMSATLGDVSEIAADLTRRTGRSTAVVDEAERPVPLSFRWSVEHLDETVEELVTTGQAPAYVVHFTQADAVEHATRLLGVGGLARIDRRAQGRHRREDRGLPVRGRLRQDAAEAGEGRASACTTPGCCRKYRRLVETLAQAGLLTVICGTDTLGVGINVPIRTVLFTGLAKFDGNRQRVLKTREFLQIAGRAGRAGFDTAGFVVVQAPEHVIENEKAKAKADAKNKALSSQKLAKKKSKPQLKKPPEGTVVWTEQTFDKLVAGEPEKLAVADARGQRDARQRPVADPRTRSRCCAGCSPRTTSPAASSCGWRAGRCG